MRIIEFDELGSTNDTARELALAGEIAPFWVIAKRQNNGRGRRGRNWQSMDGNLFATLVLELAELSDLSPIYSFLVAIGLRESLTKFINNAEIALKWPNDVLVNGCKISGILLESWIEKQKPFIAIGIGVNLVSSPIIEDKATAALSEFAVPPLPKEFCQSLDFEISKLLIHSKEYGMHSIVKFWIAHAYGINKEVRINSHDQEITGIFRGIDDGGELIVQTADNKIHFIQAGDVNFTH